LVPIVVAIDYLKIPTTGSSPSRTTASAAVYDPIDNIIITFGGFNYQLNAMSSALKTFSLQTLTWGELTPHSNLIPPGLESTQLYLRSDRKLFVFFGSSTAGTSNEIYCFNLKNFIWTIQELTGETIYGRDHFGFTSFEYNGDNYVAIFGGLTHKGLDNTLYL
jgi:hypothetical protein